MSRLSWLPFAAALLAGFPPVAHAAREREVTVTGSCSHEITPDRGAIVLTAEFADADLSSAIRKANDAYDKARAAIEKLGLAGAELRTSETSVAENREWQNNKSVLKGYKARMGLKVTTTEIARLGKTIEIAAREGIHDVSGMTTYLSPERLRKEQEACLKEAGENAKSRAQKLAASVGASLGEPVSISESLSPPHGPVHPVPMMAMARAQDMSEATAPRIEAGTQEVSLTIEAVFSIH